MSITNVPNPAVTSLAISLARVNELNLKKILAKGEEIEDKDILDALVDPLSRSSLFICEEKGCFVKVDSRIDKALEAFIPANELTLITSKAPKANLKKHTINPLYQSVNNMPDKWRSYVIDFSLVMAFLLVVFYGFTGA